MKGPKQMHPQTAARMKIGILVFGAGLAGAAFAQAGRTVVFNDAVVSQDIRVIGGRPYVPLADMAKALGGYALKTASGYQIKTKEQLTAGATTGGTGTGPTGPITAGPSGQLGQTLSDGKWRFQMVDYKALDTYTIQRDGGVDTGRLGGNATADDKTVNAKPDYSVVAVTCRLQNGQKQAQSFATGAASHTVLIDDKGTSYSPIGWDEDGGPQATKPVPPNGSADVTALFLVPFGTHLKDAVFTLANVSDRAAHDIHISLEPAG
jgi:hypothetical protein